MYLLDTNIVSELRRTRPHPSVVEWVQGTRSGDMFLSAVTIGEIQAGIEITREQDAVKADELEAWLAQQLLGSFDILAMDADAWREWARLMHRGSNTLLLDSMIAAIATVHRLIVVTRNVRDFEPFDVPLLDPFGSH